MLRDINTWVQRNRAECPGFPLPQTCIIPELFTFAEEHDILLGNGPSSLSSCVFWPKDTLPGSVALLMVKPRTTRKDQQKILALLQDSFRKEMAQ